jgi:hypothetical protein
MKPKPWMFGVGCLVLGAIAFVGVVVLVVFKSGGPRLGKRQAADILMTTLQAGDYPKAFQVLGPYEGAGRAFGSDATTFQKWIETNNFQVKSWAWTKEEEHYSSTGTGARRSSFTGYTLYGTVLFADGTSGTVELEMEILGLQYNPWRFEGFRLKRI